MGYSTGNHVKKCPFWSSVQSTSPSLWIIHLQLMQPLKCTVKRKISISTRILFIKIWHIFWSLDSLLCSPYFFSTHLTIEFLALITYMMWIKRNQRHEFYYLYNTCIQIGYVKKTWIHILVQTVKKGGMIALYQNKKHISFS